MTQVMRPIRYMLDTNMVSHLIKGHATVSGKIAQIPMAALCISAITQGELMFGLAKRPQAQRLRATVTEFLMRVDVLPWNAATANAYGNLRAVLTHAGRTLAPLDLLIAAHALEVGAVLVSNDQAFAQVGGLRLEDWTK